MGKHVSILTNIITALSIWWVGVLGGAMVIILPCQFIYWLVTHLYQKARGDDYLWILTVLIASFLVRNRISYGKIVWKALLVISIVLFFYTFLTIYSKFNSDACIKLQKSSFCNFTYGVFILGRFLCV